jgi:hypothetical protein
MREVDDYGEVTGNKAANLVLLDGKIIKKSWQNHGF